MAQVIVYQTSQGTFAVVHPAPDLEVNDVQPSVVPAGLTSWLKDLSDLPTSPQETWTVDTAGNITTDPVKLAALTSAQVPEEISDRQFMQQLATVSSISWDECFAYLMTGTIPAIFANAIATLPIAMQNPAKAKFIGAKSFLRHDLLTVSLAPAIGFSSDQLDALWTAASLL